MVKIAVIVVIFLLLSQLTVSCGGPKPEPTSTPRLDAELETQPYTHKGEKFKIRQPKGWRTDESATLGTLVFFFNTQADQEGTTPFTANINVVAESNQRLDLDGYVKANKDKYPSFFSNYAAIEDRRVTIRGSQAHFLGSTFVQGAFELRNLQLVVIGRDRAYVTTATALAKTWDKYQKVFEASLLTFELP